MSGIGKAVGGIARGIGGFAKKALPIAAPVVGGMIGGPMGAQVGGKLGQAVGGQPMAQPMPQYPGIGGPVGYPGMGGGKGGTFAGSGIGGILGHNLSQADARKELQRNLSIHRGDWGDRLRMGGDEHLRMWDAMLPRRGQEFDQNLGFQQRMFDQWLPQQDRAAAQARGHRGADFWQSLGHKRVLDRDAWGNWDEGIGRIGGISRALGL